MAGKLSGMAADARTGRLFCFGLGYSALELGKALGLRGWSVAGTVRRPERLAELTASGIDASLFGMEDATHWLISAPPDAAGDPVLSAPLAPSPDLRWIGYLSTTGVYGDHQGGWVDETTPVTPNSERSRHRARAERDWRQFGRSHGVKTQIFRLAGIYGPGRNVLEDINAGRARCIERPGQLFSRIHVTDLANVLQAAIARPGDAEIFNVCDDEPAASADVVRYGCRLLGVPPPPPIPYEQAGLSEMAQTFWADNKRVRNDRIKTELGAALTYPTYREGLTALTRSLAEP